MNNQSPSSIHNQLEEALPSAMTQSEEILDPENSSNNEENQGDEEDVVDNTTRSVNHTLNDDNNNDNEDDDVVTEIRNDNRVDDDATTQVTEINVPPSYNSDNYYSNPHAHRLWTDEEREAYEERRRTALRQELNRVQRTNFIHYSIMCLIPIVMIGLVLMNSFRDDGECEGYGFAQCERLQRSFLNAFGNDCICTGVTVEE